MAQGVSIHVIDVSRGVVACGLRVALRATGNGAREIAAGTIGEDALLPHAALDGRFEPGAYEVVLHIAEWYRAQGVALSQVPFLDVVSYRFQIDDPGLHYHFPFKVTPWGYSLFVSLGG